MMAGMNVGYIDERGNGYSVCGEVMKSRSL